jgi:hypothetical protein
MSLQAYVFTLAENAENAKLRVSFWMAESARREFYNSASLEESGVPVLLEEVPVWELGDAQLLSKQRLRVVEEGLARYKATGDSVMEGFFLIRHQNILSESFCFDMPYFNLEDGNWSVPSKVPGGVVGKDWYAVKVVFC